MGGGVFLLQILPGGLQLGYHIFEPLVLAGNALPGAVDDLRVQPQLFADGKGVGASRHADEQPVGGTQGLHIELTAAVHHAPGFQGIELDLRIVGGRHDPAVPLPELLDDGDRQRGALHRVGAGTQLIQQYQRAVPCRLQD